MRIAIVDDLETERAQLKTRLARQLRLCGAEAGLLEFESGESFLAAEKEQRFTAAFLDIYMHGMSGMDAAKELRKTDADCLLVFTTTSTDHALEGFQVRALHYLVKPFSEEELSALLDRAAEPEYGPALTVNTAEGLRVLAYAEIEYLECTHHIVHFHLLSGEDVTSLSLRVPFSAVAGPLLADGRFLQPHRSYVVSLAAVRLLNAGELQMTSGARVPIPRGREGAVREAIRAWYR